MKKIQFLILLSFLTMPIIASHAQSVAKISTASFGRYGGDCSTGRGVCGFGTSSSNATSTTDNSSTKISENSFILKVKRTIINLQDQSKIAGKAFSDITATERPTFEQKDIFILDSNTLTNLGIATDLNKILPGSYPISLSADFVEITFTLSR